LPSKLFHLGHSLKGDLAGLIRRGIAVDEAALAESSMARTSFEFLGLSNRSG
jgi:hypothetical protein